MEQVQRLGLSLLVTMSSMEMPYGTEGGTPGRGKWPTMPKIMVAEPDSIGDESSEGGGPHLDISNRGDKYLAGEWIRGAQPI